MIPEAIVQNAEQTVVGTRFVIDAFDLRLTREARVTGRKAMV